MYMRIEAPGLSALMRPMDQRSASGVYFVRLCTLDAAAKKWLWAYHEAARQKGVIIEGEIAHPDERQLAYLT